MASSQAAPYGYTLVTRCTSGGDRLYSSWPTCSANSSGYYVSAALATGRPVNIYPHKPTGLPNHSTFGWPHMRHTAHYTRAVLAGPNVQTWTGRPFPKTPTTQPLPWVPPAVIKPLTWTPPMLPIPFTQVPKRPQDPLQGHESGHQPSPKPYTGHVRRPPPPGTKERKARVRSVAALAIKGVHVATEALDLLDAFWNALPKEIRKLAGKKPTPQEKAELVYKYAKDLDMSDLMFELLWNHYSDKVIGRTIGRIGEGQGFDGPLARLKTFETFSGDMIYGKAFAEAAGRVKERLKGRWDQGVDLFGGFH